MKKSTHVIFILIYAVALVSAMFFVWNFTVAYVHELSAPHAYSWYKKDDIVIGTGTAATHFVADVADTEDLRDEGLAGRLSLGEHRAMLFVFDLPGSHPFWMKDMFMPLDMVWLNASMHIIYVQQNVQPNTYPEGFGPDAPSLYVIEFPAGTARKFNFKLGEFVKISS